MKKQKQGKSQLSENLRAIKSIANSKWDIFAIACDWAYCYLRFHITRDEYFTYKFYNYSNRYRKNFILIHHGKKFHYFQTKYFTLSKYLFYKRIPDLYAREIILAPYCGEEQFVAFAKKHQRFIIKPDTGTLGQGVVLFQYKSDEQAKAVFAKFDKENPSICEELVRQHKVLQLLNPFSVNTIRVASVLKDGEVEIISATLKAGASPSKIVDNLKSGGIGAQVDVKTGIVCTFGKDYQLNSYSHHPITGVQIIGLQIPFWKEALELVKTAHKRLPQCQMYGWDIAITNDGVDIIEANNHPGPKITQAMDCVPKGEKLLPLLKKDVLKQKNPKKPKQKPSLNSVLNYDAAFQTTAE